jgi:hypothetical protein
LPAGTEVGNTGLATFANTGTNGTSYTDISSTAPMLVSGDYLYINSGYTGNVKISLAKLVPDWNTTLYPYVASSSEMLSGYVAYDKDGGVITGNIPTITLPTSTASSATSGYTSKATIGRSTSTRYINIPPGYNATGGYYTISAVPNGSVTSPSSISGSSATVSTGTNTLTLTKTISVTPNVTTAGYISSGTAGNATVTLTASVATGTGITFNGKTATAAAGYYAAAATADMTEAAVSVTASK